MATITPPSDPQNFVIFGDLDIFSGVSADNGTGTVFIRGANAGLYVENLTDLNETTISTNDGPFTVSGTNSMIINTSTAANITAVTSSNFTTTAGTLTLHASATDSTGKVNILADGTGANSLLLSATNVVDGQVTLTSAGGSSTITPVRILATDTTNGSIILTGSGLGSVNPSVLISAPNTTSGQIKLSSAGSSTSVDAIQILASDTTDGNVFIQGAGNFAASVPAIKLSAPNATSGQIFIESAGNSVSSDAILFHASGTTGGNINLISDGLTGAAISLNSTSAAGGQILLQSASDISSAKSILLTATATTNGTVQIQGAGDFSATVPAVSLIASNTTSGQISLVSQGNVFTSDSVLLSAPGTTGGNIKIIAAGGFDSVSGEVPILLSSTNAVGGQIELLSAGDSTTIDAVKVIASGTTGGNILVSGAGSFSTSVPAVSILATNSTSGQVNISSAGNISTSPAVNISATGTTAGNILLTAAGSYSGSVPAITINATSATGEVLVKSAGTSVQAVHIEASAGGIYATAVKPISISTTDTVTGVNIATLTSGVPVNIGTSTSLTTIAGDLTVMGTQTILNTVSLTIEDNTIILNSGLQSLGADAGLAVRRYQTPNNVPSGNVISTPSPIQESGAFQTGSATPGTLVLSQHSSPTDSYYIGWFIQIMSGAGISQVRRIKAYNGTTKTATLFTTSDNVGPTPGPAFTDGLDLTVAPVSGDSYHLFCKVYVANYYDQTSYSWNFAASASVDTLGISASNADQPQSIKTGDQEIRPQSYKNVSGSASSTTITFTVVGHGLVYGSKVRLTSSSNFTPSITSGVYVVQTAPTADTFTISVSASTVSTIASSATLSFLNSSVLKVNVIQAADPGFGGISIPGLSVAELIIIPKTSTASFTVTNSRLFGSYIMFVEDMNGSGSMAVFALASSGNGSSFSRLAGSLGSDSQRITAEFTAGNKIAIKHAPAGILATGNYTYSVRIVSGL